MENNKPENPQAFPMDYRYEGYRMETGMTLRDYFAAKALEALINKHAHSSPKGFKSAIRSFLTKIGFDNSDINYNCGHDYKSTATASYYYADAMLKERSIEK